jgi:arylformamidase
MRTLQPTLPLHVLSSYIAWLTLALVMTSPLQAGPLRKLLQDRRSDKSAAAGQADDERDEQAARDLRSVAKVTRNVSYGNDKAQRLDVYQPLNTKGTHPILVMVHGGGWSRGDKGAASVVENKVRHWVPKGVVFVSVNYRLLPAADPLEQLGDVADALAYVQANATRWQGDAEHTVMMGHSAGAHLVALLGSDPTYATNHHLKRWLGTVALDSAALDLELIMGKKHFALYDTAFGTDPDLWRAASPMRQLHPGTPPFLLVCSSRREDSVQQSKQFAEAVCAQGGRAEVLEEPRSHREINVELGLAGSYTEAVDQFLKSLDPRFSP